MKLRLSLLSAFACLTLAAQDNNIVGAGVSYGDRIAGTGLYAKLIAGTGTYAFTVVDAVPNTVKPLAVTTSYSVGISQKVFDLKFGNLVVPVFVPTAAGVSYAGGNVGWAWNTGGLAAIPISKQWRLMPNVRAVKSSVGGDGYRLIAGVMIGWGW